MSLTGTTPRERARPGDDAAVVALLDTRLRDAVRRDGLDPQRDNAAVRRLAQQVVADHDQHSLTGAVSPLPDPAAVVETLVAQVAGFGPLQPYLDDPTVEEFRPYPRPPQGAVCTAAARAGHAPRPGYRLPSASWRCAKHVGHLKAATGAGRGIPTS